MTEGLSVPSQGTLSIRSGRSLCIIDQKQIAVSLLYLLEL